MPHLYQADVLNTATTITAETQRAKALEQQQRIATSVLKCCYDNNRKDAGANNNP
jgi:hypothetical protein